MQIECHAEKIFRSDVETAFDLIVDSKRFPGTFVGYGLIPSIRAIVLETPLTVGAVRRIHNSDGSVLTEHVTVLDAPTRHAYVLSGFRAPFAWLVNKGEADWLVSAAESDCMVRWSYTFTLTSSLIYPLATLLLRVFMQRAMQRCLDNMANLLAGSAANPSASA
ncbi:SRPBCC family protein [Pseudolysobacter antarcticus]|nr:SRPBCC family protein [Pseudolysobacter antarcticus]